MDQKKAIQFVLGGNLTGTLDAETVTAVISAGLPNMQADGRVRDYKAIEEATGVNYNRGWLLVRQAWLAMNQPQVLVDLKPLAAEAAAHQAKAEQDLLRQAAKAKNDKDAEHFQRLAATAAYDFARHVVGPQVRELRMQGEISWGEISVRLNLPESTCRNGFNKVSDRKDRGLRIGKGGRFAYGDPTLYLDNRKKEGAHIAITFKMRPRPEDLMNFKPKEGETPKQTNVRYHTQVRKLLAKACDAAVTPEEREAFTAKAHEVCAKYGFNEADFTWPDTQAA